MDLPSRDDDRSEAPIRRRKQWIKPTVTMLSAGSAQFEGGGADDTVDKS